jgi:hypothetical protein
MVREFAFSFTGLVWFRGLTAADLAAIATFLDFTVVILAPGLNGGRFGSIGVVAASPFPRFLEGDNETMKINNENRPAVWG